MTVPSPPPARSGTRAVAIVAVVVGALIAAGTVTSAVRATASTRGGHDLTRTTEVAGISAIDADVSAGSLTVRFGHTAQARLEVTDASDPAGWTLTRRGDTLRVSSPQRGFGWSSGTGWSGVVPWIGWLGDIRGSGQAVLTLPEQLDGIDGTFALAAGDLHATGDFGRVTLTVDAGDARLDGSAQNLHTQLNAGRADVDLADVRRADVEVSAGKFTGRLTGARPDEVTLSTTAGALELTVPDGDYAVTSDVSAGSFANHLGSDPAATSRIRVEVTAGSTVLRAGR